jgi:uncharacterized protein YggE
MMKKGMIGLVLIVLIALSFFAASAGMAQTTNDNEKRTITVNGQYKTSMNPDKAEIYLGVETQATTARQSQQDNANIVQAIKSSLYSLGLVSADIETTSYSIYPVYEYPQPCYTESCPTPSSPKLVGYKTSHMLKIKASNIDKVGRYLDAAVNAGANDVSSIVFTISDSKRDQLYRQALTEAAKNAKASADAIATGLGTHITGIVSATEGSVSIVPYYRTLAAAPEASSTTDISPGMIEVSASLSVVYEI